MTNKRAIVFGASGGIGAALVDQLRASPDYAEVLAGARTGDGVVRSDLADESSIAAAAAVVGKAGPLDLVIVATGILRRGAALGPEKSWRELDGAAMAEVFSVNAIGPALIAKHFLPLLRRDTRAVFAALSARVGSIDDNRLGGWHSYRASKAALNMLIKNFSIELAQRNRHAIAVALHPGTVNTALSRPFQRNVPLEKLFTPERSAEELLKVIANLTPADSGGLFAWDGQRIPF